MYEISISKNPLPVPLFFLNFYDFLYIFLAISLQDVTDYVATCL
ncbi:hypothetical protein BLAHAN_06734 [Blautia hansenii DSM 20583]|uniref:Uncharacterized protein n=1 Tax=Blautia hansenii DSM 20583 TaxID=537007 RepID=C9LBC6_BLAHA|nr:hypothetical protein BLAHAN_06734 [Blautia hansenii DSM 20583]